MVRVDQLVAGLDESLPYESAMVAVGVDLRRDVVRVDG